MALTKLEYTVRFLTPAFVGDAEQAGRWQELVTAIAGANSGYVGSGLSDRLTSTCLTSLGWRIRPA